VDTPAFPASEADLDEWVVYADWLQIKGDPRGELIARELALPPIVPRDQLAEFQRLATRFCRQQRAARFGHCLGHIRTVALPAVMQWTTWSMADDGTLANVRDLLVSRRGARVEQLTLAWRPAGHDSTRKVLAAVPASCRRVVVNPLEEITPADIARVNADVPPHVRELAFIDYRFRTTAVRAVPERGGDALVDEQTGFALRIQRWELLELEQLYGILPVRTQLARPLAESFEIRIPHTIRRGAFAHLVCRGERWTVRNHAESRVELVRDGVRVSAEDPEPFAHGDRLRIGDSTWTFATAR